MSQEPPAADDSLESTSEEVEARSKEIADRFLEDLESGARPDRAAIVRAHADLGSQLDERLLAIETMYALSVQASNAPSSGLDPGLATAGPEGLKTLGRFEVIAVIGRGAFGAVYKARDADLDRTVAIKVPRLGAFATSQDEERFLREARNAARLRHSGIVQVHDSGVQDEVPYIVSDFIAGETLAARLERERLDFRAAAELLTKIAEALEYAHSQGVVHRDIKPGNILIDLAGEPHVTDFGLARRAEGEVTVTMAGEVLGTPAYMAPEQAAGESEKVDARSDVYSLGVVLYEMLTGERPFRGSRSRVIEQVLKEEPRALRSLNDHIPRDLESICLKAMAKELPRRYARAGDLAADLRRYLGGEPIQARPVRAVERLWRWSRRNPVVAGLTVAIALLLLTVAVTSTAMAVRLKLARDQAATNATREKAARLDTASALERAEGLRLAAQSSIALPTNPGYALLLAIEGAKRAPGRLSANALLEALGSLREERMLFGHEAPVGTGAYSPDGRQVLTASWDGTLRIWGADSGEELQRLHGPCQAVHWAAWSPDGTKIAAGCREPLVRLYEAASGKQLVALEGHVDAIEHFAFSADGRRIASGGRDRRACVWDVETHALLVTWPGHQGWVLRVAFSPDSCRVATASQDGTARLWELPAAQPLHVLRGHGGGIVDLAFDPAGRRLITASQDATARLWDAATGQELLVLEGHLGPVLSASFAPDGRRVLTASGDGTARIWDAVSGSQLAILRGHDNRVNSACFSPDGQRVLTASDDRTARLWEAARGAELAVLRGHRSHVRWAAFSPDGLRAITTSDDYSARLWDAATAREEAALRRSRDWGRAAVFSHDLQRVAVPAGKVVRLHDPESGDEVARLVGHESAVTAIDFSADGVRLATASPDGTARVWQAATGKERVVLRGHKDAVRSARFSPDGSRVATASYDHTGSVWDPATGARLLTLTGHGWVEDARFSPSGKLVATASADGTARLWDAAVGTHLRTFQHGLWLHASAFSQSGSRFLTASAVGIMVWDVDTGARVASLTRHEADFLGAVFSADDSRLATLHDDGTARVWDLAGGTEIATLKARRGNFVTARFDADTRTVATVEADGRERSWALEPLPVALARRPHQWTPGETERAELGTAEERSAALLQYNLTFLRRTVELACRQVEADRGRAEVWFRHARDLSSLAGMVLRRSRADRDVRAAAGEAARFVERAVELPGAPGELAEGLAGLHSALLPDLASYAAADAALRAQDRVVLVPEGANWKYFPGTSEPSPGLEWSAPGFDDAAWREGPSPFGRAQGGTSIAAAPVTLYLRHRFRIEDPGRWQRFHLQVTGEDGFIVYVNGVEVFRQNSGKSGRRKPFDARARRDGAEDRTEVPLGPPDLRPGDNLLALQGLRAPGGQVLSLSASLAGETVAANDKDEALLAGFRALAQDGKRQLVLLYLEARVLARRGRHQEAAAMLAGLVERAPLELLPLVRLVECLRALGKREEAAARLKEGLARLPDLPSEDVEPIANAAWEMLILPYRPLEAYLRAHVWSRRVRAIDATETDALTRIGMAQYRLELHAEALETLRAAGVLRIASGGVNRHHDLAFIAMALARLQRIEEARSILAEMQAWLANGRWNQSPYVIEAERVVAGAVR